MLPPLDNPFWQFSLHVYALPSVAEECLTLQRELSIDVNVLLFHVWVGAAYNVALEDVDSSAIIEIVRTWHDTAVGPLRAVRRNIKTLKEISHEKVQTFRKEVAALELRAEQIEQAMLLGWWEGSSKRGNLSAPRANIRSNIELLLKTHQGMRLRNEGQLFTALMDAALAWRRSLGHNVAILP